MLWSFWQCSACRNKSWHSSRLSRSWEILPCVAPCRVKAPALGKAAGSHSCLSWAGRSQGTGTHTGAGEEEEELLSLCSPTLGGTQALLLLPEAKCQGHPAWGEAETRKPVCSRLPEETEQGTCSLWMYHPKRNTWPQTWQCICFLDLK